MLEKIFGFFLIPLVFGGAFSIFDHDLAEALDRLCWICFDEVYVPAMNPANGQNAW